MIKILHKIFEKISNFSHQHNILSTQVTQLKSTLELERKQIAQSLIVMNQQYERRINVIQTYFISTIYFESNEEDE
jgi:regulator of PEP synthase PpsR (kinase-PPPase family)